MRIADYAAEIDHTIDRFKSHGARFGKMAGLEGSGQVGCIRLDPGGVLGRHRAHIPQMFCVIDGSGEVTGGDGRAQPIRAGQVAFWDAGERHGSSTVDGMTAIVIELTSMQTTEARP
jgi:quercetin dioxygenase-like cupin family protein